MRPPRARENSRRRPPLRDLDRRVGQERRREDGHQVGGTRRWTRRRANVIPSSLPRSRTYFVPVLVLVCALLLLGCESSTGAATPTSTPVQDGSSATFESFREWLHDLLLGDAPPWFLAEIVFRSAVMYLWAYTLVRTLTKQSVGQLSVPELLLVVGLGSSVGDPMFYADVPLLHGMLVVAVVVLLLRGFNALMERSERASHIIEGQPKQIVADGVLDVETMKSVDLDRDRLFEQLRLRHVAHLGEVRVAYLETSGQISVFLHSDAAALPGLPIVPPPTIEEHSTVQAGRRGRYACRECGYRISVGGRDRIGECANCGSERWVPLEG